MLCTDSGVPPASCFPPSCDQRSQAELTSAPAQVATASEVAETTICTWCRKQYAHFPWILQGLRGRAIDCPLHVTTTLDLAYGVLLYALLWVLFCSGLVLGPRQGKQL
jgi:hypothetical protein